MIHGEMVVESSHETTFNYCCSYFCATVVQGLLLIQTFLVDLSHTNNGLYRRSENFRVAFFLRKKCLRV